MDSLDQDVLRRVNDWLAGGRGVTLGTVTHTWGSAPRPVGSMMAIRDDGQVIGSVSGGCIEDDLIMQVKTGKLAVKLPEVARYGVSADQARQFGLPCGGTVEIVLEPLQPASQIPQLLQALAGARRIWRELNLASGAVTMGEAATDAALSFDGLRLRTVHGPGYRLIIIGGGQLSRYLATMAVALDYSVTVCDPRDEYHETWAELPQVQLVRDMPDDAVVALKPDSSTAVVALTHDPKLDDLALMEALRSPAFYVGALGSKSNNDKRRERLLDFDCSAEQIARLRGPVGLTIGAQTPPEIALSILAEMTAMKRGVSAFRAKTDEPARSVACAVALAA